MLPSLTAKTLATAVLLLAAAGCTQSDALQSPTAIKLRHIARVYLDYAVVKGVGPSSELQLRSHAKLVPVFDPALGGESFLTSARPLVSDRDGQELVVRYGQRISTSNSGDCPPIVFERLGEGGYALVAFANGTIDCVQSDQVETWLSELAPATGPVRTRPSTAGM